MLAEYSKLCPGVVWVWFLGPFIVGFYNKFHRNWLANYCNHAITAPGEAKWYILVGLAVWCSTNKMITDRAMYMTIVNTMTIILITIDAHIFSMLELLVKALLFF